MFGRNGITMGYARQNVEEELEISIELKKQLNNLEEYAMDNLTEQIFVKNVLVWYSCIVTNLDKSLS